MVTLKKTIMCQGSRGGHYFPGRVQLFPGLSNCSFSIETLPTCDFPGGLDPLSPLLDPPMGHSLLTVSLSKIHRQNLKKKSNETNNIKSRPIKLEILLEIIFFCFPENYSRSTNIIQLWSCQLLLTLYVLIDFSVWFVTLNLGW